MAVTAYVPTKLVAKLANGEVDYDTHAINMLLFTAFTFDQDADAYLGDVTRTEHAAAGGYTTGGIVLATKTIEQVDASNKTRFKSAPFEIDPSTLTAVTHAVLVDVNAGSDATRPILVVYDLGGAQSTVATVFRLTHATDGWLYGATT